MAHSLSAKKRIRQNIKLNTHHRNYRTQLRHARKSFLALVEAGDMDKAKNQFEKTLSLAHRVASKGIIHKNQAANLVSALHKRLNQASA